MGEKHAHAIDDGGMDYRLGFVILKRRSGGGWREGNEEWDGEVWSGI